VRKLAEIHAKNSFRAENGAQCGAAGRSRARLAHGPREKIAVDCHPSTMSGQADPSSSKSFDHGLSSSGVIGVVDFSFSEQPFFP
jgi:hypothetical protein